MVRLYDVGLDGCWGYLGCGDVLDAIRMADRAAGAVEFSRRFHAAHRRFRHDHEVALILGYQQGGKVIPR